jgi:hypothetical protein
MALSGGDCGLATFDCLLGSGYILMVPEAYVPNAGFTAPRDPTTARIIPNKTLQ